jgi:lipoic acid synthetase
MNNRLPEWLKKSLSLTKNFRTVASCTSGNNLHTICVEAKCPNRAECFSKGNVTFLIMGNVCSRKCGFCGVHHGKPLPLDPEEPKKIAAAAERLHLRHIVITSVTRDDLPDGGASHFAESVRQCRKRVPASTIEILIPDFRGKDGAITTVFACRPDIISHNIETVPRLYDKIRPQADYEHSLGLLTRAQENNITAKSGFMAGLGETDDEIIDVLRDLHDARCRMVTIGQYLRPSKKQVPVQRYVPPEHFSRYEKTGKAIGFTSVIAGPLVRSSYRSGEIYGTVRA